MSVSMLQASFNLLKNPVMSQPNVGLSFCKVVSFCIFIESLFFFKRDVLSALDIKHLIYLKEKTILLISDFILKCQNSEAKFLRTFIGWYKECIRHTYSSSQFYDTCSSCIMICDETLLNQSLFPLFSLSEFSKIFSYHIF